MFNYILIAWFTGAAFTLWLYCNPQHGRQSIANILLASIALLLSWPIHLIRYLRS